MKRNVIYIFILVFLIGVVVNYLYREIMGLATNLMGILIFNAVGLGSVWLYFTIKKQDNKVKHKIKEVFLIAIAAILSISYVLIYGLNPLNHNHQLLCIVGMGGLIVLQFIGERFLKMRRVMHWLIIMPILIILYFLI